MSLVNVRDELNLTSSSISLSEDNYTEEEEGEENDDVDDDEVKRMLSEEITNYEMVGSLPPTPRPMTRASSVSSLLSTSTLSPQKQMTKPPPVPCKNFRLSEKKTKAAKKLRETEKDICHEFGIDTDDPDFDNLMDDRVNEESDNEKGDDGIFIKPTPKTKKSNKNVKSIVDELIDADLSSSFNRSTKWGRQKKTQEQKEPEVMKPLKLDKRWTELKISQDGRCAVLKDDVETVRKTKEAVDALIMVLEKTREKMIKEDKDLVFMEPPFRIKNKSTASTP